MPSQGKTCCLGRTRAGPGPESRSRFSRPLGRRQTFEEQERLKREEMGKRAKGYRMKLLEFPEGSEEILEPVMQEPVEDRKLLWQLIWKEMVENLPEDGGILKYLELMERLPRAASKQSVMSELRGAFKTRLKHQVPDRKKMVQREKKKLAAIGISGSAVMPKIPQNPPPDPEFIVTLERCKKELLSQSDS